ncbi:endopeptidase La [Geodermatophilus sp. SYSU D00965]
MAEALRLPVLPLDDAVLLPGMVLPVPLDGEEQAAVDASVASAGRRLLVVPRLDGVYSGSGVLATLEQVGRLPTGEPAAIVRATARVRIGTGVPGPGAALWVEATPVDDGAPTDRTAELAGEYRTLVVSVLRTRGNWQTIDTVSRVTDPGALADLAGYAPYLDARRKLELLETTDVDARLERLVAWTRAHLAEMQVSEQIRDDVREGMERSQREFLLRQQLAAIRKELGEDGDGGSDLRARAEAADLPEQVRTAVFREIDRLEATSEQSPEGGWIRTWLDTVLDLPWNVRTPDDDDVAAARAVLDADHHGLDDVKDRIVEHLAVRARRAQRGLQLVGGRGSGAVLALVGPPGVGKTSLGESVARALGRRFVRVALGGVRDEAEIRGHRRTYVGALPGRIVRALREAGSMNPVVLLDEIDKVGSDHRGDPAAALLEVLDPEQNHTFRDHYLDLDLDLSDVLFLATANVVDTIPQPLLDRMEFLQLDGYTEDEKVAIARGHLLPREMERAALTAEEVTVGDDALRAIAAEHTREAGVRQLDRALARVLRKAAATLARDPSAAPLHVTAADLRGYLGRPRFTPETAERTAVPGVATGLAVTGTGGDVLFIEVTAVDGEPGLTVTGQLGDVMKESAQIALSYARGHAAELGIDPAVLQERLHLHVPAGAVPKDGPSAGVTMVTALASLAAGRPVRADVGMTGEVTLSGRVLPIGGVKQKLLAADRAGLTTVFLPARNEPDLDDVPAEVRDRLEVRLVGDVAGLVAAALEPAGLGAVERAAA